MGVWIIRAGRHGEFEQKFIQESRVYVTWRQLDANLAELADRTALNKALAARYPDKKPNAVANWVTQIWPFAHEMKRGDLVIVPLKGQPAIQIGEITSDYHFEPAGPDPSFIGARSSG